jgi:hypothetical protein
MQKCLQNKSQNVLECPDLNPIEHLMRDLKIAVRQLVELERICREEWEKLLKYRCAKLVASYPKTLRCIRCQRSLNKFLSVKAFNTGNCSFIFL